MFSNYKNTVTGQALIEISPHGTGLLFRDTFPGSISDSSISDSNKHCAVKGVFLNCPAHKSSNQF